MSSIDTTDCETCLHEPRVRSKPSDFEQVYDYVLGIANWKAAGLPIEGDASTIQTVADAMRPDVPTCDPSEPIRLVGARVREAGWDDCVVV